MSVEAIATVRDAAEPLRAALLVVDVKRRPSFAVAMLVARELADRYRDERAFVDETTEQLIESTGLTDAQVRNALRALHDVGCWRREAAGNRHRSARRVMGPLLLGSTSRGNPAINTDPDRGVPDLDRGVEPSTSRGSPATPRIPVDPRALVRRAADELDRRLAPSRLRFTSAVVDEVLAEMADDGIVREWPSHLVQELDHRCAKRLAETKATHRSPSSERWVANDPDDDPHAAPVARPRGA